jgi:hypothetical protein
MPFNGSGVFQRVRNWVADAAAGIKIRADYHDSEDDGFAAGLTNCITKDGQTIITQNIPMNSKRLTGLADPVNTQDAATKAYADTKLANVGGAINGSVSITGNLDVGGAGTFGGTVTAQGYRTRSGLSGAYGGNWFNFQWDGDLKSYVDDYFAGSVAFKEWVNPQIAALQGTDNSLQNQINTKQGNLGFTPVQQGGGSGQATNKIYIGWSGSKLKAQVDNVDLGEFNFGQNALSNGRLAYAGDVPTVNGSTTALYEPYSGAVMTGWEWVNVGYPIITYMRFRYLQLYNGGWYTVGYA